MRPYNHESGNGVVINRDKQFLTVYGYVLPDAIKEAAQELKPRKRNGLFKGIDAARRTIWELFDNGGTILADGTLVEEGKFYKLPESVQQRVRREGLVEISGAYVRDNLGLDIGDMNLNSRQMPKILSPDLTEQVGLNPDSGLYWFWRTGGTSAKGALSPVIGALQNLARGEFYKHPPSRAALSHQQIVNSFLFEMATTNNNIVSESALIQRGGKEQPQLRAL